MSPESIFSLGFVTRGKCGALKKLNTASIKEVNAYEQESCTYFIRDDGDEQKDKDRGRRGNHQVTLRDQECQYGISPKKKKSDTPKRPPIGAKWQQTSGPAVQLCRTFFIVKIFFETEYIYYLIAYIIMSE